MIQKLLKQNRPCRGSHAAIIFRALNICCVSSGTVNERYCSLPREVSGAKPGMKKWSRGKGQLLHIDGQLSQIGIELAWETETCGDAGHCRRDQVVQIAVCWRCQFQRSLKKLMPDNIQNSGTIT